VSDVVPAGVATVATPAEDQPSEPALSFYALTYLEEGDEVTVGRPDAGIFVVLPADGAALLRRLAEGMTCADAANWYAAEYGESVDVADFVAGLDELGFVRHEGDEAMAADPVRWMRLGHIIFSPAAGVLYAALLIGCLIAMLRTPALAPSYHNLFFTTYMSVLMMVVLAGQLPLILLHEAAHALAGRRLGLRSKLSIGRRFYYVVFQTTMDGLVGVPRRQRYLPMLAGMLADIAVFASLTLFAEAARGHGTTFSSAGAIALALAYTTLLRLAWQFWFFLQTDIYFAVVTVLGCVDLQTTAKQLLRNTLNRMLGREAPYDPATWHPRDYATARWYSVLMVAGYAFSIVTLLLGLVPAAMHVFGTALHRFDGSAAQGNTGLLDSVVFLCLGVGELFVAVFLGFRERRLQRSRSYPIAGSSLP